MLSGHLQQCENGSKQGKRLRRSALRFLEASDKVTVHCEVFFPNDLPGVVLNYVSALENVLSGKDESAGDLKRRTAQRSAVLVGRDDAERKRIYHEVDVAYGVRNKIAHGDEPNPELLTSAVRNLRPIVRKALIAAIVLGRDPDGRELSELCDDALLSQEVLRDQVIAPLQEFRQGWARD